MKLGEQFTKETGRCPDNDIQYYADWLENIEEKLTNTQQLKAKILTLHKEYNSKMPNVSGYELCYLMEDLLSELKELSTV